MKAIVTGAAGFLGSHLVDYLLKNGHRVIGYDNFIGGYTSNIFKHPCYTFVQEDIEDLAFATRDSQHFHDADVVYHCAALAYEGLSVFSPCKIVSNIVGGTLAVFSAAARGGVSRFVNCSSMARYGTAPIPYRECVEPAPVDPYGMAKLQAEQQLNLLGKFYGMWVVHVVPHNIIGPRQKYDDPYRNVASIMANLMLQGRQPVIYGDGEQLRCFSFIQDVVPYLYCMGYVPTEYAEVFNLGPDSEEAVTINTLAHILADIIGFDLNPTYLIDRPCEVKQAVCSSAKIRGRFRYETKTPLRKGLESLVDYIKTCGPKKFLYHLGLEIPNNRTPKTWTEKLF